jgi:glycosyltransferase involved in cell wall biosynthesis
MPDPGEPAPAGGTGRRGGVCVEIAVKDDPRLLTALDSLAAQRRRPDRVLIAGSPLTPKELEEAALRRQPSLRVELLRLPGGPVDARVEAMPYLREPTTAFLDSDEVAPPEWLERIVAPVEAGSVAFAGGPTRPLRPPSNAIQHYMELLEVSIYDDLVRQNIAYLPLGNTAWDTAVLRQFGFDARVTAEDHDLETRVLAAGHQGVFLPEAWVYHDKSYETSYVRWARKRYVWLFQMAVSLMKNEGISGRLRERRRPILHPLWFAEQLMKPIALAHARAHWSDVSVHGMSSDARVRPP